MSRLAIVIIIALLLVIFFCNLGSEGFGGGRVAGHGGWTSYGPYDEWYLWDPLGWNLSYERPAAAGPHPYVQ